MFFYHIFCMLVLFCCSGGMKPMARTHVKVTATVPETLLAQLDMLIAARAYPSRSAAIEAALMALLRARMDAHIEAEAAKLDPCEEQQLADEGLDDYTTLVGEEGAF
jgi:Arc/MetJ-type ribon-helix-helix transcriptional regulator